MPHNFQDFLTTYDPGSTRTAANITPERDADGNSPFVIVRYGRFAAVLVLMPMNDHLSIDVHPFVDGEDATAGAFGMSDGHRVILPAPFDTTSHGWPSARLITVLIGEQG